MARRRWSEEDLRAAKAALVARWLRPGPRRGRMGRRLESALALAGRNVHGVGIGRKVVAGVPTGERCVRVHVVMKIPRALLSARDTIPAEVDGVPTDVVESPPAHLHPAAVPARAGARGPTTGGACTRFRRRARRPLVAGVSVAHHDVTAGTIAAFCRSTAQGDDAEAVHLLSNNHVLANVNRGFEEDDVLQPGPFDGGGEDDHVADLHRFVPIRMGGRTENHVDAAIARLVPGIAWRPEVCSVGHVTGATDAAEDQVVRKHGRTTGLTEGTVTDIAYDALVGMDDEDSDLEALFVDQVRVGHRSPYPAFGLGGDSGSLVVTAERTPRAVGLYFAGPDDGSYGLANPIAAVLSLLQVALL